MNLAGGRILGRYAIYDEIAHGGMATVHLGRLLGPAGFARTVAIKRLHPQFAKDPEFVAMFVDEARLAARIHHPNVVPTLDVVTLAGELFLVMDYVRGEPLVRLVQTAAARGELLPQDMTVGIMVGVLRGLHAAHEATGENGEPLGIVHRDVSPQNVLVGVDGIARVLDFGVAKAAGRIQSTREGQLKGKLAYMAPEQLRGDVSRRTDVYAAGVVLWEALTGQRMFIGDNEGAVVTKVMLGCSEPPSTRTPGVSPALDAVTMRALAKDPGKRFVDAREMAHALEEAEAPATMSRIGEWVSAAAADSLTDRAKRVETIESDSALDLGRLATTLEPRDPPASPYEEEAETLVDNATTDVSSGLVTPPGPHAIARGRTSLLLAAGVGAIIALVALSSRLTPPAAKRAGSAANPGEPVSAPVLTAPAETTALPPGSVSTPWSPPPAASVAATNRAAPPSSPLRAEPMRRAPLSHAQTAQSSARCDPPFYFDAQGVRIFKKECL